MGFKCSVLGHRFEEPGLVHEREPRGDEVIIIRRNVMVCTLCGEQRVLAEKKEITKDKPDGETDGTNDTIDGSTDIDGFTGESDAHEGDDTSDTTDESTERGGIDTSGRTFAPNSPVDTSTEPSTPFAATPPPSADSVENTSDRPSETNATDRREPGGDGSPSVDAAVDVISDQEIETDGPESGSKPPVNARRDDGIVLSDDGSGREYGEWPGGSQGAEMDDRWEPDALRGPPVFETSDSEGSAHTGPSALDAETDTGEIITDGESDEKKRTETDVQTDERTRETFYCPSCGFTVDASDSPFRSGDSCPDCRAEYLVDEND